MASNDGNSRNSSSSASVANSSWASSLKNWRSILPSYSSNPDQDNTVPDPDPSSHQVTDYQEGEREDIHGNTIQLGNPRPLQEPKESTTAINDNQPGAATVSAPTDRPGEQPSSIAPTPSDLQGLAPASEPIPTIAVPVPVSEPTPTTAAGKVEEVAEKAAASITKVVMGTKKNVVLPDYYEQFPDIQPSLLLTVPVGSGEMVMLGQGSTATMETSFVERLPYCVKTAVNSVRSAFSLPKIGDPAVPQAGSVRRGTYGIRKAVIIGVHGWYPRKALRTVIGEPTGTSRKFCEEMDLALKHYLETHGKHLDPEDVTIIPLEGEGKVMNRVEILHESLMQNRHWKNAVHEADLVLVATHSQGTPTSILLLARWIEEGLLRVKEDDPKSQRIGMLAMAGITHGPFPFLKGNLILRWFEADAAKELFEFMDSESYIAKKYREGLKTVLSSGVRLTCVASLEDQVVPLYSAVMTSIHHPSIVRAVYIDAASYQNDFLINLIAFSLRLRNAGVDDHGILVHLSEVIAGRIYGEGHSTIYEERDVYLLSLRSLFEPPASLTLNLARSAPVINPFKAKQRLNPFYLPWGMRGVADEIMARGDQILIKELERLKKLYNEWNPVTKGMKEIKFRLEPVRSKL
ncbi:hypothetical protein BGX27_008685 [Mortierella sp. AM989]|nr:hypothetical protein BGX27_008685 [Mortierella sp. AM989]